MRQHRRTQDTVSNNSHDDNFDPANGIEGLHAAILRVHTLVHVANQAADELRCAPSPEARRALTRMQILIGKASEEASIALAESDELIAQLADHRDARGAD